MSALLHASISVGHRAGWVWAGEPSGKGGLAQSWSRASPSCPSPVLA